MEELQLSEVIEAYYDCRKRKRNTYNALKFEYDYEQECVSLWEEINERRYKPRRSIAFVVDHPVKREIFAADFRDRVVHHLIARRIYPLLERQFITDSYSTQKGKGTLFGVLRMEQHIRECSRNYTRDCHILKLDIRSYFMSIDKERLYTMVCEFLEARYEGDLDLLRYLLRETIFNRPEENCIRKVPPERWIGLPRSKSLLFGDGTHGLPIGNLTSQLLALLYLDPLDHLITEEWEVPHYGRYVDDMVLVHPSKEHLLEVRGRIDAWLMERGMMLHPRKVYLQHYTKGVQFVGGVLKPGRKYLSNRTMGKVYGYIGWMNKLVGEDMPTLSQTQVEDCVATMNSYLGMMCHYNSQRRYRRLLARLSPNWYYYVRVRKKGRKMKMKLE